MKKFKEYFQRATNPKTPEDHLMAARTTTNDMGHFYYRVKDPGGKLFADMVAYGKSVGRGGHVPSHEKFVEIFQPGADFIVTPSSLKSEMRYMTIEGGLAR